MLALALFVAVALPHFNPDNLHPFMPYGFGKEALPGATGEIAARGGMAAAAIIFFAFYGLAAISTAAEETKKPGRAHAIGIVGSMTPCVDTYILTEVTPVETLHFTECAHKPTHLPIRLQRRTHPRHQ